VSTSDTGMVYLYRIDGTRLTPFDTCRFTSMGYFAFPKILGGNYIIRAALTPGSAHFPAWFPAYYRLASAWKAAILLNLADSNCYNADIYLAPANVSLTGPGSLSGTVERTYTKSNNAPLANAEVVLLDGQLNALTFAISDKSGKFAFDNLPYGGYSLFVEYPGKYSRVTAIWLDATTPTIDDLHLEVFNHDVTGLPGTGATGITAGDLFPNPATDAVNMALELPQPVTLEFSVITLAGSTVWSGTTRCNGGSCVVTVPVSLLGAGMYLFTVGTADGTRIAVKKLLRY
jgi:hypothetical protein